MAIEIRETLQVEAPIDRVWKFAMDPEQVVQCMPGATLDEVVDARNFLGTVKVKVGAITASYKGRVEFVEVDEERRAIQMLAEGRETGGGTARGRISLRVGALPGGATELVTEASVDLTGRIVQVGRGMIQGVSHEIFKQFAAGVKQRLEGEGTAGAVAPVEQGPLRVLPLLLKTVVAAVVRFFRRLFGRPSG